MSNEVEIILCYRGLTEVVAVRVASILAPHDFEVNGTNGAIREEYGVQALVIRGHNCSGVSAAADWSSRVDVGAG